METDGLFLWVNLGWKVINGQLGFTGAEEGYSTDVWAALKSPDTASRLVQRGSCGVGELAQAESEPSGPFREAVVAF